MGDAQQPRLARSYLANVAVVVLTLFPGLINTSAIALLSPVIGRDLGVAPDAAAVLPLISDAALAFGCVLAAEMTRRLDGRTLYFWLIGTSLVTSLASAVAPSFSVLLAAHVVHGLVAGMLFVVTLPPLLTTFGGKKLSASASVLVPALFGASTLGPLAGGLVAAPEHWRALFALEVLAAVVTLLLARQTLAPRKPSSPGEPIDWFALTTSAVGSACIYAGAGSLAGHEWRHPFAVAPLAAGVLLYLAMIAGEARMTHPLVPVRKLATSIALIGTLATVLASAAFAALTQCFTLTLLHVDGLDARATGLTFWPEFLTALASGYVFGQLVTTRWVLACGPAGLAFIALAALLARILGPVTPREVGILCVIGGFGAGLSISPGLLVVALSFERKLVTSAIAMLNLFRLTGGFISGPGVEHTIGSRAQAHLYAMTPAARSAVTDRMVRGFVTGRFVPHGEQERILRGVLALGIGDAYLVIVAIAAGGMLAIAALVLGTHVHLQAPDLQRFDRGEPALETPQFG